MKDADKAIRVGYTNKLSSLSVNVYDKELPSGSPDTKYLIISTQTFDGARSKSNFEPNCTVLLDIVVRSQRTTGMKEADDIADEVLQLINPLSGGISIEGFDLINTKLLQSESANSTSVNERVYRRLLRFQHKVVEK
jgi:hypothetical protein